MNESDKRLMEINNWFYEIVKEAIRPKCPFCGAKLSHYWFYEGFSYPKGVKQFQICPRCKKKVVKYNE